MIYRNILSGKNITISKIIPFIIFFLVQNVYATNPPNPDLNPNPSVPATVGNCPDYGGALNLPTFDWPKKKSFRSWISAYWSRNHSPYHMVNDQIVNPNDAITVVGKFDYNRIFHKDLEREYVHAYIYGTDMEDWEYLGRYLTDTDGKIYVPLMNKPANSEYIVRMVVEGDLTSADGFISVAPEGQDTVIFDIDGTLTLSDFEQVGDYFGASVAQSWPYAKETVQAYIDKGYRVIFLTGRPYWIARDTREWFTKVIDLPQWQLRTDDFGGSPLALDVETYKREYLSYLQDILNLNIVRAYGNASTDIAAYIDSGIDKSNIWIIGENAGANGTNAINGDYSAHLLSVVNPTPEAQCRQ